jgi:hypothetical protein
VAYRIFGHLAAADDAVQKTSLRLNRLAPLTFVLHDMSYVPRSVRSANRRLI